MIVSKEIIKNGEATFEIESEELKISIWNS